MELNGLWFNTECAEARPSMMPTSTDCVLSARTRHLHAHPPGSNVRRSLFRASIAPAQSVVKAS